MDVLLMNTYDWGGAATATKRIHQGLRRIGVDSQLLVQHKRENGSHIIGPDSRFRTAYSLGRIVSDPWPLKLFGGTNQPFSVNWLPDDVDRQVAKLDPDLVHLNWIGEGFLNPKTIGEFDVPVVWRFPDMWPMTGGCHYASGCDKFTESCGACPQLGREIEHDITRWTHRQKRGGIRDANVTAVTPSTWLAEQARKSSLFSEQRIEVIPNGLDTDVFKPYSEKFAREVFGLPEDRNVVLFGSVNPTSNSRKGFDYLHSAVRSLYTDREKDHIQVVIFGSSEPNNPPEFGFDTRYIGYLNDSESLALLYAAADVMVVPSKYEGFGQTVIESLACGTPVVAFDATGPQDTIDHKKTGYLADPYDSDDLAHGIEWVLEGNRSTDLGARARERAVEQYELETVARQYRDLYATLI